MPELSMNIPGEVVERAVRDKISAAIARELGNPATVIREAVGLALTQKVNRKGIVSPYTSDNKYTFLEVMATNMIQGAAREALKDYLETHRAALRASIEEAITKDKSKLAQALVDAFAHGVDLPYRTTINIELNPLEE